jgi:tetratricopeptide (TPR) repeat protein
MCNILSIMVIAVALTPVTCGAQSPLPLRTYPELVHAYRQHGATIVPSLLLVPHAEISRAVDAWLAGGHDSTRRQISWHELRAAALLHSEAAIYGWTRKAHTDADFHLKVAGRLLDRVRTMQPAQDDFARRWYDLMYELARQSAPRLVVEQMRTYAQDRWPHDPARDRFMRGLEAEIRGSVEGRIGPPAQSGPLDLRSLQAHWFWLAAREYREALERNPGLHAAALHLGRIHTTQGDMASAEPLLRQALTSPDPRIRYLSMLLLGSIDERRRQFSQAEQHYRSAIEQYPEGQAAVFAVAQLLSRTGREDEARDTLNRQLVPGRERAVEPLWTYLARPESELAAKLDELRVEVWR